MKKAIILITTFFFTFVLIGCKFIDPSTIEEASEAYCRDNPESELCQGENVGDLDDDVIRNIFNTILAKHDDVQNGDFCIDYFSVTDIEFYDKCLNNTLTFFPDSFDEYSIIGTNKLSTLESSDLYEVVTSSKLRDTEVTFRILLTEVEGVIYISGWEYNSEFVTPESSDIPYNEAKLFFEQFIIDYQDGAISSSDLCSTYYPNNDQNTCIDERDKRSREGITVTLVTFEVENDRYLASVSMSFEDYEVNYQTYITLKYNHLGSIEMELINKDFELKNLERFMRKFLIDFQDSEISIIQTCAIYYDIGSIEECLNDFDEMEQNDYKIVLQSIERNELYYIVTFKHIFNDDTFELVDVNLQFNYDTTFQMKIIVFVLSHSSP